MKISPVNFT